ncbi:MAG TPA: transglutaminase family protein [Methylomirabilota bacterium]|nr:transglutaminase family protein [Methylomirabilota bacterium]
MTYEIVHRTTYDYSEPVAISHHAARMEPKVLPTQHRDEFRIEMEPEPKLRKVRTDYFANRVCFFSIQEIHQRLEIVARSCVKVTAVTPPVPSLSPPWEQVTELFSDPVSPDVVAPYQFVFDSPLLQASPEIADYARQSFSKGVPLLVGALDLGRRIHHDFKYDPVATTVATPLEEVLAKRCGVCQDFAHLAIACLRSLGLSARYVSGYLRTHAAPGKEKLVGADASHAWFSVFCPSVGWVDFDPTNNVLPAEGHITVAYGRDFGDVSPLSGILTGGGTHEVKVSVDVTVIKGA